MNIIELFENAGIYRENLKEFTFDDTVKVKQYYENLRISNPNIDTNAADDLISAMNEFPTELLFISNNRILYNFFSGKNHSRNRFSSDNAVAVSIDAVKSFIERFLSKSLNLFFEQKMAQNNFESIDDLLIAKEYLPQNSLDNLSRKITEKLDFVLNKIDQNPALADDVVAINFIKFRSFYAVVSHFRSAENDQKIKALYDKMTSPLINLGIKAEFLNPMIIAMSNYNAVDPDLDKMLKANQQEATIRVENASSRGGHTGMSPWAVFAMIVIVFRLILLMARCSR